MRWIGVSSLILIISITLACGGGSHPGGDSSTGTTGAQPTGSQPTNNQPTSGQPSSGGGQPSSGQPSGGQPSGGNAGGGNSSSSGFVAGIAHVAGNYGFTQNNYLIEGAQQIAKLGGDSIFIYLTPLFRSQYPDPASPTWPAADLIDLASLAQTTPYSTVFSMGFKTIVLTAYSFANADQIQGIANSPTRLWAEKNEMYELTKYLYSQYGGSGKTFILKDWEGDWIALGTQQDSNANISDASAQDMIAWLTARQQGVSQARNEAGSSPGVQVLNAIEVNRVMDYAQQGLTRVINAVVPHVNADMVTYSSYDSTSIGSDAGTVQQTLTQALQTIEQLAPDPLGMGPRRILISEYGLFENQLANDATWRTQAVLSTASNAGLYGAFLWDVFDNTCLQANGQPSPVDAPPGNAMRPSNNQCRGLWVVRPDGSISAALDVLKQYW